jgi:hypothetical protein
MKECLNELTKNFDIVEMKVHRHQKAKRQEKKKRRGDDTDPVPASVRQGILSEELYQVECQLHAQAGLPPPERPSYLPDPNAKPTSQQESGEGRVYGPAPQGGPSQKRVGMITFSQLIAAVKDRAAVKKHATKA